MYGPPLTKPPVLFIGYQPGGAQQTDQHFSPQPGHVAPETSYYATESWRLAKNMQGMWGKPLLTASTGLNAIFFRAPSVADYRAQVDADTRARVSDFCLSRAAEIISAIGAEIVVAIGFATLELFGPSEVALENSTGRALIRRGKIGESVAFSTLHLSGAQISSADRATIAHFVCARINLQGEHC